MSVTVDDIWYKYSIWCMIYDIWYMIYDVWCMMWIGFLVDSLCILVVVDCLSLEMSQTAYGDRFLAMTLQLLGTWANGPRDMFQCGPIGWIHAIHYVHIGYCYDLLYIRIWYMIYDLWYMIYDIWYMLYDIIYIYIHT